MDALTSMALAHKQEILFLNVLLIYCTIELFLKRSKETAWESAVCLARVQRAFRYYHTTRSSHGAVPKKGSTDREKVHVILSLLLKAHLRQSHGKPKCSDFDQISFQDMRPTEIPLLRLSKGKHTLHYDF